MAGAVSNEIADIAQRSRTGIAEVADLYARLTRTGKDFGATQGEIATATETVSKALKVSGASAAETQSTLVQLGQALGSGRLQGDELRSMLENAPVVAQAMRRTGSVEANAGGASVEAISAKLGNSIDRNKTLQKVYMPVDVASVRAADESRKIGRQRLASEQNEFKKLKLTAGES